MRLMMVGDTHGNTDFLTEYLFPTADAIDADAIVQLGDFGYWEHETPGVEFLDRIAEAVAEYAIPLHWLHGNHDKWSLAVKRYGLRNEAAQRSDEGFIPIRDGVNYIPTGTVWAWDQTTMRAFGGAYSPDKAWRLDLEAKRRRRAENFEERRRAHNLDPLPIPTFAQTLWFPEEEHSDVEFDELLAQFAGDVDIVFSHDIPRGANPAGLTLSQDLACLPNQDRLARARRTHRPTLWLHGHLHHRYLDVVPCGDDERTTVVVGLSCDEAARPPGWVRTDAWCVLDIAPGMAPRLAFGRDSPGQVTAELSVENSWTKHHTVD